MLVVLSSVTTQYFIAYNGITTPIDFWLQRAERVCIFSLIIGTTYTGTNRSRFYDRLVYLMLVLVFQTRKTIRFVRTANILWHMYPPRVHKDSLLVYVSTEPIGGDSYWTSRKNSLDMIVLIELSTINKVSLV